MGIWADTTDDSDRKAETAELARNDFRVWEVWPDIWEVLGGIAARYLPQSRTLEARTL